MRFLTTGKTQVRSVRCYVVFNRSDGKILHVHQVVDLEGAAETSDDEGRNKALKLAVGRGAMATAVDVLQVEADSIKPGAHHAVNTLKRSLVRTEKSPVDRKSTGAAGERIR
jgi:hypothetical protein